MQNEKARLDRSMKMLSSAISGGFLGDVGIADTFSGRYDDELYVVLRDSNDGSLFLGIVKADGKFQYACNCRKHNL